LRERKFQRNKMATTTERLGIVETKVENLSEKIDHLKVDVKEMHDCLDKTRDDLKAQLETMYDASCTQHAELAKKISSLEKIREKTMWMVAGAVAAAGIFSGHLDKILAFFV
jgi:flagellar capping protein FliD